jgi:hypothetical protein
MIKWLKRWVVALLFVTVIAAPLLSPRPAQAQFYDDDPESELTPEQEDEFLEGGTDESGMPLTGRDQDVTEGDSYTDETPQQGAVTVGGRQVQLRLATDREMLPLNAAWGSGTGLLIGGWFALINASNNRDTQRSIGLGIVIGAAIGVAVGLKTVINPTSALGDNAPPPSSTKPTWSPLVTLDDKGTRLGVRLTF